jgi:hypothetical protein
VVSLILLSFHWAEVVALPDVEKDFPDYHRCYDNGEAYSAAFLITKDHLLSTITNHNLTWSNLLSFSSPELTLYLSFSLFLYLSLCLFVSFSLSLSFPLSRVNCEMGSFIYISNAKAPSAPGGVVQSLDVLDYSVIHLSAYERLMKRHGKRLPKQSVNVTEKMSEVSNILRNTTLKRHSAILSKQSKQETHRLLQVLLSPTSLSVSLSLSLSLSLCLHHRPSCIPSSSSTGQSP